MPMGRYTQLGPVRTWYDEQGRGDPLVLMHGGLVDARPSGSACSPRNVGDMDTPPTWKGRSLIS